MTRRLLILGGFLVAFGLGVAAQTTHVNPFASPQDLPPLTSPCGAVGTVRMELMPMTLPDGLHVFGVWQCQDGRFLPQSFSVELRAELPTSSACPGVSPGPGFACIGGGWKPPGWRQ